MSIKTSYIDPHDLLLDMLEYIKSVQQVVIAQDARIAELEFQMRRVLRMPIPTNEALRTFDLLKKKDPDLTLAEFTRTYDLNYATLQKARFRRRRKEQGMSDV